MHLVVHSVGNHSEPRLQCSLLPDLGCVFCPDWLRMVVYQYLTLSGHPRVIHIILEVRGTSYSLKHDVWDNYCSKNDLENDALQRQHRADYIVWRRPQHQTWSRDTLIEQSLHAYACFAILIKLGWHWGASIIPRSRCKVMDFKLEMIQLLIKLAGLHEPEDCKVILRLRILSLRITLQSSGLGYKTACSTCCCRPSVLVTAKQS